MRITPVFFVCFVIVAFASCKKDDDKSANSSGCKLSSIVAKDEQKGQSFVSYTGSAVSSIRLSKPGQDDENTTFTYDSLGRLLNIQSQRDSYYGIKYDNQNRISEYGNARLVYENGWLARTNYYQGSTQRSYAEYTYTNGLLTGIETHAIMSMGEPYTLVRKCTFTYSAAKTNAAATFALLDFLDIRNSWLELSLQPLLPSHIVIEEWRSGGNLITAVDFELSYSSNDKGYPTSVKVKDVLNSDEFEASMNLNCN